VGGAKACGWLAEPPFPPRRRRHLITLVSPSPWLARLSAWWADTTCFCRTVCRATRRTRRNCTTCWRRVDCGCTGTACACSPGRTGTASSFTAFAFYPHTPRSHPVTLTRSPCRAPATLVLPSSRHVREQGFCSGLVNSRTFVPLLSRGAINHPDQPSSNFSVLTAASKVIWGSHHMTRAVGVDTVCASC
jgi:hypothetical protein